LTKALAENKEAAAVFQGLPPSGQKEIIRYISNLKTAESREKNIKQAIGFLLGKNRFMGRDAIKPSTPVTSSDAPGQAAVHYDEFYGPLFFEPYAIEVAKRVDAAPASIVLEIAAGTGRVTRHISERIPPSAKLIASDVSDDMLSVAKKKLSHLEIDWQNIDAQQLPFDDNSIDLVVCCFGYMFVPDKPKAFAEAHRILKPGGQLLFTTWDKLENNGASYISRSTALSYLEEPLPASYNLATSMNDEAMIKPLLQDAGFAKMSIEKVGLFSVSPTAKEAANGLVAWGPIYEAIKKLNPSAIDEIKIKVEKELTEKFGSAPMVAPMSALICQAWK
jgi:ubiquinone/menaquinone biosynthesis C-methylase UbiE